MIRLFHVSDVHFGAEDPAALAWFARTVADERPDGVVMTGDLTMRALESEFDAGGKWLQSLGVPVTVEVGNHDIPYYNDFLRRLVHPYERYAAAEAMIEKPLELAGVAIVPLKTISRFQFRIDQSQGRVSRRSLKAAIAATAEVAPTKLVLIAAHHPLVDAHTQSHNRTSGGREALAALARAGATAVLSGHVHDPFDLRHEIDGRTIRTIGAGTLSLRTRASPPAFNELRVEGGRLETILRTFSAEPDRKLAVKPAEV